MSEVTSSRDATRQVSGAPAMSRTQLKVEHIAPAKGAKYSPNLYAYMNSRQPAFRSMVRLFVESDGTQWLGFFDDVGMFVGARMGQILGQGKKASTSCPINLGPLQEVEGFWDKYLELGRCAIDPEHKEVFLDDRWRMSADGLSRECLWCHQASQRLVRKVVQTTHESWVNNSH